MTHDDRRLITAPHNCHHASSSVRGKNSFVTPPASGSGVELSMRLFTMLGEAWILKSDYWWFNLRTSVPISHLLTVFKCPFSIAYFYRFLSMNMKVLSFNKEKAIVGTFSRHCGFLCWSPVDSSISVSVCIWRIVSGLTHIWHCAVVLVDVTLCNNINI